MTTEGGRRIRIKKWDPSTLKPTSTVLICGKRNTGKSVVAYNLMHTLSDKVDACAVFCPTESNQGLYRRCLPPSHIHPQYSPEVMRRVLDVQKQQHDRGHGSDVLVVLDDCMIRGGKDLQGPEMMTLYLNGRHRHVGCIITAQYGMFLTPSQRSNLDVVIATRENVYSNRERLYKQFMGVFPTFEEFARVFQACTSNYETLVCLNDVASTCISDVIFWYKAKPIEELPAFQMGRSMHALWEYYRSDRDDDSDDPGVEARTI